MDNTKTITLDDGTKEGFTLTINEYRANQNIYDAMSKSDMRKLK